MIYEDFTTQTFLIEYQALFQQLCYFELKNLEYIAKGPKMTHPLSPV